MNKRVPGVDDLRIVVFNQEIRYVDACRVVLLPELETGSGRYPVHELVAGTTLNRVFAGEELRLSHINDDSHLSFLLINLIIPIS